MIRIVSDTSTLYSTPQAKEAGFEVAPLSVTINEESYLEFDEISSKEFVGIINQGHLPVSSQPPVGKFLAIYDSYSEQDEILSIHMAQGLSGTYEGAVAAAGLSKNADHITVINSRTLCGPHRYLVEKAVKMVKEGHTFSEIKQKMEEKMATAKSYLIPADFDYLRRGGRLSPLVSYVGQAANLSPVMTQTDDGCRLTIAGIRHGFTQAVKYVAKLLVKKGIEKGYRIYITHGDDIKKAEEALAILKQMLPEAIFEIHPLSPAFITQGGPSCVAIQYIQE